jgi:hypothetical protein
MIAQGRVTEIGPEERTQTDEIVSGSCPMATFGINGIET